MIEDVKKQESMFSNRRGGRMVKKASQIFSKTPAEYWKASQAQP
jgi:hypothetical protein